MELLSTKFNILYIPYISSLLAFIPALINIGIVFYILYKLPRNKTTDIFTLIVVALTLWQLEDTILRLPIPMKSARLWDGIFCIGWLGIAPLLFHFSCRFAGLKKLYRRSSLLLLYTPFVFFYILYMSNLPTATYEYDTTWGWINQLNGDTFEIIQWNWTAFITIASIYILVHHAVVVQGNKQRKAQARMIAIGIVIPAFLAIITQVIFLFLSVKEIPLASSFISLFSISTIMALSKYKLFKVSDSLKSHHVLENLNRFAMIISPDKKIIFINKHASALLGIAQNSAQVFSFENIFDRTGDDFKRYEQEVFHKVLHGHSINNFPGTFLTNNNERINVMISSSPVINNHIKQGILLVANDITQMVTAQKDLELEKLKREKEVAEASMIAQENERKLIGGELHDNVNQILASSLLYLSIGKKQADIPYAAEIESLINSAIAEIRKLSHSLIAPSLDEAELSEAIDKILDMTSKTGRFDIKKEMTGINEAALSEKMKLNVYRIVQEQLNNIIKYSKAQTVSLKLSQQSNDLILQIADDGIGFDTTAKSFGRGLQNMKSRAAMNNGKIKIVSSPGKGCELSVVFENFNH